MFSLLEDSLVEKELIVFASENKKESPNVLSFICLSNHRISCLWGAHN